MAEQHVAPPKAYVKSSVIHSREYSMKLYQMLRIRLYFEEEAERGASMSTVPQHNWDGQFTSEVHCYLGLKLCESSYQLESGLRNSFCAHVRFRGTEDGVSWGRA